MATSIQDLRDAQRRGIIKGVVNYKPGSNRPLNFQRRELDHFICDADVCNLFLLALAEVQDNRYADEDFSWFSICGIHGRPYQSWHGIDQNAVKNAGQYLSTLGAGSTRAGYCSHSSVLFPTWHRPYVAMMEQAICLRMHSIAQRYPGELSQVYEDAAYRFRMPYLDPFAARVLCEPQGRSKTAQWQCGAPQILSSHVVRVRTPENPNMLKEIPNPLYSYEFPTVRLGRSPHERGVQVPKYGFDKNPPMAFKELYPRFDEFGLPPAGYVTPNERTVRSPDPESGRSDHIRLKKAWLNLRTAGEEMYSMLVEDNTYERFSNNAFWATATRSDQRDALPEEKALIARCLEAFHDAVHSYFGFREEDRDNRWAVPSGHMWLAEYSCFDPVFWLHHSNIDRLFAIWQYRNPRKTTFSQQLYPPNDGTWTEPVAYQQTQDSPLVPFLKENPAAANQMRFWTSAECMDTAAFGYTYAEQFMYARDLNAWINNSFLWLKTPGGRPAARSATKFPVDFGPGHAFAPCLPSTVLLDTKSPFPHPYIRDPPGGTVRAVRSIAPEVSGVSPRLRKTVDAPGADSTDYVDANSYAAFINTNSVREWDVFVRFEKFSAGGGFAVHFSLGDLPKGPDWKLASNYVGEVFNFASTRGSGCQNCEIQEEADLMKAGILSLTVKLQQYLSSPASLQLFSLKTLGQEHVIPFLTKHLQWLIIDYAGNIRQPSEIGGFKIMVMTRVFHPPASEDVLGTWDAYEPAVEITHNKAGGLNQGESF